MSHLQAAPVRKTLTLRPEVSARRKQQAAEAATAAQPPAPAPAPIEPKPKPKPVIEGNAQTRREVADAFTERLVVDHPAVFDRISPKPLAIGIHVELFNLYPDVPRAVVKRTVQRWTTSYRYRKALAAEGGCRHGLDGQQVGTVDEKHREHAALLIGMKTSQAQTRSDDEPA